MRRSWSSLALTRQSLIYLLFCLAGIAVLLAGGIWPAMKSRDRQEERNQALRSELEIQGMLRPVYERLRNAPALAMEPTLGGIAREPLPRQEISSLPALLEKAARAAGVTLAEAAPLPQSMREDRSLLMVKVVGRGPWSGFRDFLLAVSDMPFMAGIERIETTLMIDNQREYSVHAWVYLQ